MRYRLIGLLVVFGFAAFGCDPKPGGGSASNANKPPLNAVQPAPVATTVTPNTTPAQTSAATPNWSVEKPVFDFGAEWEGRKVVHLFDIRNDGAQPLRMSKPKAHCSCSQATAFPEVIEPGKTGQIQFTLDLKNKRVGTVNETLVAQTNDPQKPTLNVTIKGIVRNACIMELVEDQGLMDGTTPPQKAVDIAENPSYFDRITANQNLRRVILMKNSSGMPLKLQMMPIRSAAVHDERGQSTMVPPMFDATLNTIQEGEVYELTIVGKPPFQPGTNVTAIQFTTGIPEYPIFEGVRPSAICPPRIELSPYKIVFNQQQAPSRQRSIKLRNNGTTPLKVTSVAVTDPAITVTLLPINPADPTLNEIEVLLPQNKDYQAPTYGEVVRIETTDAERAVIDVQILPHMSNPATPRPADKPLQFTPGKMLQ